MAVSLVRQIDEIGEEPLHFDPEDFLAEHRVNAWWVSCSEEECAGLPVEVVADAYRRCVERIRERLRESGHQTPAVFYVWHDELAGQLRSNTTSVAAHQLPFGVPVVPATLERIVQGYLRPVGGSSEPEPTVEVWAVSVA